jgi:RimJ/RimL family protein N-acetyltransferase
MRHLRQHRRQRHPGHGGRTAGQRGRGHASNALTLLVGYAASISVTHLEAHVATDNHASRHVAESAGFSQAGTFTDHDGTEMIRYTCEVPRPREASK